MSKKNLKISKTYYDKYYLTYNQITNDYEVYILSEDEYNNLPQDKQKEVRYMILIKKSKTNPPEPKGPPAWALAMEERIIFTLKQYVDQKIDEVKRYVDQKIDEVNSRLDSIVKKNNLKE